jgi:hypothetical protein
MGKDGPIFNPQGIRYMPPDQGMTGNGSLAELATGLAGINLATSLGTLALSAATLREVQRLHQKMDEMIIGIDKIRQDLGSIAKNVARIDMRAAENNLREAMKHVLGKAIQPEEINLKKISALSNDFENLFRSMEPTAYFNFGIRLATDVRDNVQSLCDLLSGVRMLVAQRHNQYVEATPERAVSFNPGIDYFLALDIPSDINSAIAWHRLLQTCAGLFKSVGVSINERFSFSDEEDHQHFNTLIGNELIVPISSICQEHFGGGVALYDVLPDDVFEGDPEKVSDGLFDLANQWLWGSDGGLLMRTSLELDALEQGYEKVFWKHLQGDDPVGIETLSVSCALPEAV